jgi:hypothetical protein
MGFTQRLRFTCVARSERGADERERGLQIGEHELSADAYDAETSALQLAIATRRAISGIRCAFSLVDLGGRWLPWPTTRQVCL